MTNEDNFIKEWKMFYDNDHTVVNDVSEKRMRFLLEAYRLKVTNENTIYVKVRDEKKTIEEPGFKSTSLALKVLNQYPEYNPTHLIRLAREVSTKFGLTTEQFCEKPSTGKSKAFIVKARVEFCKDAITHFPINANRLSEFLNLNHTAISYYLHGKKARIKNKFV